jgi:hypothetical protein
MVLIPPVHGRVLHLSQHKQGRVTILFAMYVYLLIPVSSGKSDQLYGWPYAIADDVIIPV